MSKQTPKGKAPYTLGATVVTRNLKTHTEGILCSGTPVTVLALTWTRPEWRVQVRTTDGLTLWFWADEFDLPGAA
jgi:hypothetical protein